MDPRATPQPATTPAPPGIRLRDPAGAVAAVPYLLGYAPRRSLVVVGVDEDRTVGASLRCDLEPGAPPGTTGRLWAHLQRVLLRNGCRTSLVLAYTDDDPDDLPGGWVDDLLDVVLTRRPAAGAGGGTSDPDRDEHLGVLDVLVVGPSRFRSAVCRDRACCPPGGTPLAEAGHHPVAAGFVLAGRSPAADRESVAPEGTASAADRSRTQAAVDAAGRSPRARLTVGGAAGCTDDLLLRWCDSLPGGPDPELTGALAAAWRDGPALRDACLAVLLPGGTTGALHDVLADPSCTRATDVGSPVLRRMAALTSGPERAAVLAAHAWLCWVAGEGTAARVLAERAQGSGHDPSLARLVLQCLAHGVGAPWTSSRGSVTGSSPRVGR